MVGSYACVNRQQQLKKKENMNLKESRGEGTIWETLGEGQRRGKWCSYIIISKINNLTINRGFK